MNNSNVPSWILNVEKLKDKQGVDFNLLQLGMHPKISVVTNEIMISLAYLSLVKELPKFYGQLAGCELRSLKTVFVAFSSRIANLKRNIVKLMRNRKELAPLLSELFQIPISPVSDSSKDEFKERCAYMTKQLKYCTKREMRSKNKIVSLIASLKEEKIRSSHLLQFRTKYLNLRRNVGSSLNRSRFSKIEGELRSARMRSHKLEKERAKLQARLLTGHKLIFELNAELTEGSFIKTKTNRTYDPKMRNLIMKLIKSKVACSEISNVIEDFAKFSGFRLSDVPSERTIGRITTEMLGLSQQQMAEILPRKESLTLLTDETSKFGTQSLVCAVSTSDNKMFLLS